METKIVKGVECVVVKGYFPYNAGIMSVAADLERSTWGVCSLCPYLADGRPHCLAPTVDERCFGGIYVEAKYWPIVQMRSST